MNTDAIIEIARECLKLNDIPFIEYNKGIHLMVEGPDNYIDFWPTTGKWRVRGGSKTFFGLYKLKEYILKNRKLEECTQP